MKLILIGGVHGVGKTTLMERVQLALPSNAFTCFDPGEYFWSLCYMKHILPPDAVEELVVKRMMHLAGSQLVVSNWHYAVWQPDGYIPQLRFDRFARLLSFLSPSYVGLFHITAATQHILDRRMRDRAVRKRKLDLACVVHEQSETERLLDLHLRIARSHCPSEVITIENDDFEHTVKRITQLFSRLCS